MTLSPVSLPPVGVVVPMIKNGERDWDKEQEEDGGGSGDEAS